VERKNENELQKAQNRQYRRSSNLRSPPPLAGDQDESVHGESVQDESVHGESVQDESVHGESVQHESVHGESVQDESVHGESVQDESVHGESPPLTKNMWSEL